MTSSSAGGITIVRCSCLPVYTIHSWPVKAGEEGRSSSAFLAFLGLLPLDLLLLFAHNSLVALTRRQKEVLDFIIDFVQDNGYSPSYQELARGLQPASGATVHKHVEPLESRGYLRRGFNQSR